MSIPYDIKVFHTTGRGLPSMGLNRVFEINTRSYARNPSDIQPGERLYLYIEHYGRRTFELKKVIITDVKQFLENPIFTHGSYYMEYKYIDLSTNKEEMVRTWHDIKARDRSRTYYGALFFPIDEEKEKELELRKEAIKNALYSKHVPDNVINYVISPYLKNNAPKRQPRSRKTRRARKSRKNNQRK